jgi:hypothetical protein
MWQAGRGDISWTKIKRRKMPSNKGLESHHMVVSEFVLLLYDSQFA